MQNLIDDDLFDTRDELNLKLSTGNGLIIERCISVAKKHEGV